MNRPLACITLLIASALLTACPKDKTDSTATTSATPLTATSLPPRADEEQKASAEITRANYKTQLDQVEKEIEP